MTAQTQVERANTRLFKKFASEICAENVTTEKYNLNLNKVADWLGSNIAAFYPAARPQISGFFELAQQSLRNAVGFPADANITFHVSQYQAHPMTAAYIRLVRSVEKFARTGQFNEDPDFLAQMEAFLATVHSDIPLGIPQPSAHPNPSLITEVFSAQLEAGSQSKPHPEGNVNLGVQAKSPTPETNHKSEEMAASSSFQEHRPTSSASQPVKKRKPKKKFDIKTLAQADLQSQKGIQAPVETADIINQGANPSKPVSLVPPPFADPGNNAPKDETKLPTNTDDRTPLEGVTPEIGGANASKEMDTSIIVVTDDLRDATLKTVDEQPMNVDVPLDSARWVESIEAAVAARKSSSPASHTQTVMSEMDDLLPLPEVEDLQISEHQESAPMDIDTEIPIIPVAPVRVSSPVTTIEQTPEVVSPRSTAAWEYPVGQSLMPGVFGPDLRIIAHQPGLKQGSCISIAFDIPEAPFDLVTKWSERFKSKDDVRSTVSLTLGCYFIADLREQAQDPSLETFEKQVSSAQSKWPQVNGGLSLKVLDNDLPLSPPFHVNPDGLVDVSRFIVRGHNVLELRQRQDFSRYMFILHAHHPTRRQIQEVEERRTKDREWHRFLKTKAAPIPYTSMITLRHLASQ